MAPSQPAVPALGSKRNCPQCSARFYDLGKNPATCPKCQASFDTSAPARTRRPRGDKRVAELLESDEEALVTSKPKAARPKPVPKDADEEALEELEDIEDIEGEEGLEDIEDIEDIDDMEDIDVEGADEEPLDDDITLEDEDIEGETLIDDVDEEETAEDDEEGETRSAPSGRKPRR